MEKNIIVNEEWESDLIGDRSEANAGMAGRAGL